MIRRVVVLIFLVSVSFASYSQNEENKWVVGLSGSFISFGNKGLNSIGERFNIQVPKVNVSRYIFRGFTLDAGFTYGALSGLDGFFGNAFDYFSFDGNVRYDFKMSDKNLVPYVGLGGSIIGAPSTLQGSKTSPTMNLSAGGTFWIAHHWGINAQTTYKVSSKKIASMESHFQFSAGVVYSFGPRVLAYRLWDGKR